MADYTPPTWSSGDQFTPAQATAIAAELDEQENLDVTQDAAAAFSNRISNRHVADVKRRTWWANKANTSTIPGDDNGSIISMSGANMADARILNGRLTIDATTAGVKAWYRQFAEPSPITRVGGRFNFIKGARTTKGGAVNCTIMNKVLNPADTTVRFSAHWLSTPDYWLLQKYNNATAVFTDIAGGMANGAYAKQLVEDGRAYEIDIVRIGSNTALLYLPDGRVTTVTDTDMDSWSSSFGFHEVYMAAGNTDSLPGWIETWADTATYYGETDQLLTREMLAQHAGEIAYAQITTSPSITTTLTDVAGLAITIPKSDKPITIEAFLGNVAQSAGGWTEFVLANPAGTGVQAVAATTVAGALPNVPIPLLKYVIPAGTAGGTWKIRGWAQANGGTANVQPTSGGFTNKAYLRATF